MNKNIFNSIRVKRPRSNYFDLTHDVKLSCNMGQLVPIMCTECVPGDKFTIGCESMIRFAPLIAPVYHRMDVRMEYFFVPYRLLWPNWESFITNTKVGGELPVVPFVKLNGAGGIAPTKLMDYFGIPNVPAGSTQQEIITAAQFAAYSCIWDEYYRDQNLQTSILSQLETLYSQKSYLVDGNNTHGSSPLFELRNRCWEHDYFTSSLPWAQKGDPVTLPLGNTAPVKINTDNDSPTDFEYWASTMVPSGSTGQVAAQNELAEDSVTPNDFLYTDLENATAASVNDLRRAFRLQEWLERMARGGSRYVEQIFSMFGVKSPDSRLQRPEYIVGVKSPVVISDILQTSATGSGDTPQGNPAGNGQAYVQGNYGKYFCQEHGFIIGLMSVLPKTAYQQGIPKQFLKTDSLEQFYWPQFANIGEQEVLQKEVYAFDASSPNTFGYVPRYAEYKYENNRVAGEFRTSLDFWTLSRIFDSSPGLNAEFVQANPTFRVFAVEDPNEDHLWCQVVNHVKAVRPMPKFGTPTI